MPDAAQSYRILGVDPGLGTTGYAVLVLEDERAEPLLLEGGVLRPAEKAPLEERLAELHGDLSEIIRQFQPDIMAVENLYSHVKHPRTSIIMGHARGVIFLAASQAGIPVQSYGATEIKKSLSGAGRASKSQIQRL
ncbi:MAG: crossover junction endodeoxyribonuclease RuvC, partial [bacterium]|nr:crossover junction endodeoxyribonuclease RuvC [bacterium]